MRNLGGNCPGECLVPKLLNQNHIVQVIESLDFWTESVYQLRWNSGSPIEKVKMEDLYEFDDSNENCNSCDIDDDITMYLDNMKMYICDDDE